MGDLNFNLLDSSDNSTEMLVDTMFDHHFYPLINKPTRITEKSYSAIDHIWTDIINTKINSNIVVTSVSDHLPIMQISTLEKLATRNEFSINFSFNALRNFQESLMDFDFANVASSDDPDQCYKNFASRLVNILITLFQKLTFPSKVINPHGLIKT